MSRLRRHLSGREQAPPCLRWAARHASDVVSFAAAGPLRFTSTDGRGIAAYFVRELARSRRRRVFEVVFEGSPAVLKLDGEGVYGQAFQEAKLLERRLGGLEGLPNVLWSGEDPARGAFVSVLSPLGQTLL